MPVSIESDGCPKPLLPWSDLHNHRRTRPIDGRGKMQSVGFRQGAPLFDRSNDDRQNWKALRTDEINMAHAGTSAGLYFQRMPGCRDVSANSDRSLKK